MLRKFPLWSATQTKRTTYHRQVILDAIASREITLPSGETQRQASDFVWIFQDWNHQGARRRSRERDPGVSIAQARTFYPEKRNDLEWARDHLAELGAHSSAQKKVASTLGENVLTYKLPLGGRVTELDGRRRFGAFNWRAEAEALIWDQLAGEMPDGLMDALENAEELGEFLNTLEEGWDSIRSYISERLPFLREPESVRMARELMEEIDQYAEKAAEVAMELMPGDTNVPCE